MHNKMLREYIETLFADAPNTVKAVEVKEEILQNLQDKYNDLLADGKSEEAAYNIAIASVGDISELLRELQGVPRTYARTNSTDHSNKKRSALLTSIAIAMYIISPVPIILLENKFGLLLLFVFVAAATAMLIYNGSTKSHYVKEDATMADDFKEWRANTSEKQQIFKSVSSALWALTVVVYLLVSFKTGAWYITWVIFLIANAITHIVKALFDLKK